MIVRRSPAVEWLIPTEVALPPVPPADGVKRCMPCYLARNLARPGRKHGCVRGSRVVTRYQDRVIECACACQTVRHAPTSRPAPHRGVRA